MIIGIDFDNTIACYDILFSKVAKENNIISKDSKFKSKIELRTYLRSLNNGDKIWMKLQGLVYGKYMSYATLMPGVVNFLVSCKLRGYQIYIVSHKTKYGHYDKEKTPLREKAMEWMELNLFFDKNYCGLKRENVFFADTLIEKVKKITQLKCDWFIDDLPKIFNEPSFPKSSRKILYDPSMNFSKFFFYSFTSWRKITKRILKDFSEKDLLYWSNIINRKSFKKVYPLKGRGNSIIYRIQSIKGYNYILKHYPQNNYDLRPRLNTEYDALSFLKNNNINNIPKPISKDSNLGIGIYQWINGNDVIKPSLNDLEQAIVFIKRLFVLSKKVKYKNNLKNASEDCISINSLYNQINFRLEKLKNESLNQLELLSFLNNIFEPTWKKLSIKLKEMVLNKKIKKVLPRYNQILSPSDFGFHNAIKTLDGKIFFIDFEYFGWDDPVKLTADFLWHPAMDLNSKIKLKWKKSMVKIFSVDPNFKLRLKLLMPFYGLRWALIILNDFLPQVASKRKEARKDIDYNLINSLKEQLQKSKKYCMLVKEMVV